MMELKVKKNKERALIQSGGARMIFNAKYAWSHLNAGKNQQTSLLHSIFPFKKQAHRVCLSEDILASMPAEDNTSIKHIGGPLASMVSASSASWGCILVRKDPPIPLVPKARVPSCHGGAAKKMQGSSVEAFCGPWQSEDLQQSLLC